MSKPSPLATKIVSYVLPFVVFGLIGYTWYIYIFRICVYLLLSKQSDNKAEAVIFMMIASFLWILALLSYIRILLTSPGKPPSLNNHTSLLPPYYYSPKLFDWSSNDVVLSISRHDGQPRYCHLCQSYKPDRTHHCKECNACVLKMDHHCPWVSGCVGFKNYKFFFLFVLYTGLYGLWVFVSSLPLVIKGIRDMDTNIDAQWLALIIIAFIFGLTVCGFAGVHVYYIIKNETTIEHLADRPIEIRIDFDTSGQNFEVVQMPPQINLWTRSRSDNWKSVMGTNPWTWFIPVRGGLVGDGTVFPYNDTIYQQLLNKAIQQRQSMDVVVQDYYEPERISSIESTAYMT
ncbi:DHHC palmitoyltransferase-domain-containing protein, partial [Cokeromyces recurvatus]|uniref:DHHC palmitoyltransferase-domain-containing protein n=1 Tax=Cokeromyces recurvatus TaxID=90255 RepID=UPI0022207236